MISAVIVDDEMPALNLLKMFLQKTGQVNILGAFVEPNEALENIISIKPDVVFLDIEMPEMSGLELASLLMEQNDELMVVFVTCYNQYALEAFQVNALDYILKPVTPNTIQKCISRLIKLKGYKNEETDEEREKKICCFGDLEVYGNGGAINKWPTRKVEEMLAYFIVHRDCNVESCVLEEILWPEEDPDKIKANLHTSLYRLRKTIKENGLPIEIYSQKGGKGIYRFNLGKLNCDLVEFENAILKGTDISKDNINEFEYICGLYRDDLFSKKNYGWCEGEKEYLKRCYLSMIKNMASFYIKEGLYQKAIDKLLIVKRKSPFDEEIHREVLKVYSIQKNRALLIKCHQEFKFKLFKEIGVQPQEETNKLFIKLLGNL